MRVFGLILVAVVAVGALWLACVGLFLRLYPQATQHVQFGDVFGAASSLFSALAFVGLLVTIFLQRKELSLQREELRLQRKEMEASRGELANQARVQRALYLATIAQVKVSAAQAEVEAIRMESESFTPGGRDRHAQQIRAVAERVAGIAAQVELSADVG